jgi:hypothetical protein
MSGAGFGMFAYPYFIDLALHTFHWRGTVLLMAGIYLNCAVSGIIFRPISFLENSSVPEVKTLESSSTHCNTCSNSSFVIEVPSNGNNGRHECNTHSYA